MVMKKMRILYIVLFFCLCLAPVLLIPVFGHQMLENDSAPPSWPSLIKDEQINRDFFSEVSDYTDKNIAFRRQLVSLNGLLMKNLFRSSAQDDVIVGKDGYLFYTSSLDTYTGRQGMNSRQLQNAAADLRLLQDILEKEGVRFVFTIAPNKNSLYGKYMPSRYQEEKELRPVVGLTPLLKENNVNYVDLFEILGSKEEVLYHKTDSHWNNRGAALAAYYLLQAGGAGAEDYGEGPFEIRHDFQGDLFAMICPAFKDHETEIYYKREMTYRYLTDIQSNYDPLILTENPGAPSDACSIVVFRDSFGNSLLPFLADQAGDAYFSRNMPIEAKAAGERGADLLIWEIVERNLPMVPREAPVVTGVSEDVLHPGNAGNDALRIPDQAKAVKHNMMEPSMKDGLLCIQGNLDAGSISDLAKVYVVVSSDKDSQQPEVYQAFQTGGANGSGYGYCLYLDPDQLTADSCEFSLLIQDSGSMTLSETMRTMDMGALHKKQKKSKTGSKLAEGESAFEAAQQYVGKPVEELIAVLGEPLDSSTGPSCNSPGDDGQYFYDGFTVYTQSEERGGTQIVQHVLKK